jgi:5-oxoprolinase (ATP-hydrolysing)
MVGRAIPLNSGCLRDVTVHLAEHSLLNPSAGKAVAGGNVETSQRIVDVLLGALGRAAASQGTMNNVSFGQAGFGYYETIAGGAGAGPGFAGASAVHTHMTNTRITDPEIIEQRFPVRIREFSVRRGSGGAGQYPGGAGICREYEFLEPLTVSLLTERRVSAPFGLAGGEPGMRGRNLLNARALPGHASFDVQVGDRLRLETPGGGGYGRK